MKRLLIHLVIGMITFFAGVAVSKWTASTPKVRKVQPATLKVSEPPKQVSTPSPPSPAPNFYFDYNPKEFNPRGDYFIIGPKPRGFREFDCLELGVDHTRASGVVFIQIYANQTYESYYNVSGVVTNRRLTFVARPVFEEGFTYSFDGYFLRGGVLSNAGKNTPVLKGTLIKSKGGVRVAMGEVKFRIEYLGC